MICSKMVTVTLGLALMVSNVHAEIGDGKLLSSDLSTSFSDLTRAQQEYELRLRAAHDQSLAKAAAIPNLTWQQMVALQRKPSALLNDIQIDPSEEDSQSLSSVSLGSTRSSRSSVSSRTSSSTLTELADGSPLSNGNRLREYLTKEARNGDIIFFGPYGENASYDWQLSSNMNCQIASSDFAHVGLVLKNPKSGNFEVFNSKGGDMKKVLFTTVEKAVEAGRTRIAIRKCAVVLDQAKIDSFIEEYDGVPYRTFSSMSGCIREKWDALKDDISKLREKCSKQPPAQETEGVICSELVAIFLNKMGIIDNAFRRWKRYLPRHFVYGMNFVYERNVETQEMELTKGQGMPREYLKKLLAVMADSSFCCGDHEHNYRLIESIPGQRAEHRFAYQDELTEIYRGS